MSGPAAHASIAVKVSPELVAQLGEWSRPVEVMIVAAGDGYEMIARWPDQAKALVNQAVAAELTKAANEAADLDREAWIRCIAHGETVVFKHVPGHSPSLNGMPIVDDASLAPGEMEIRHEDEPDE